jgi:hypothetical protein
MNDPTPSLPPKPSAAAPTVPPSPVVPKLDEEQIQMLQTMVKAQQNLPLGIAAGIVSALLGAVLWAVITVVTRYQIGYMAIGVGYLVGFAVRKLGKGTTPVYSIVAALCALLGCLSGNLLSACGFIAQSENIPLLDVVFEVFKSPEAMVEILRATFSPIDLLFYGIAIHGAYKTALRTLTADEIRKMTT